MDDIWRTNVHTTLTKAYHHGHISRLGDALRYLQVNNFPPEIYTTHLEAIQEIWTQIQGLPPTPASTASLPGSPSPNRVSSRGGGGRPPVQFDPEKTPTPISIYRTDTMSTSVVSFRPCDGDTSYILASAVRKNNLQSDDDGTLLIRWTYLLPAHKDKTAAWHVTRCTVLNDIDQTLDVHVDVLFGSAFLALRTDPPRLPTTEGEAPDPRTVQALRQPSIPSAPNRSLASPVDTRFAEPYVATLAQLIVGVAHEAVNNAHGQVPATTPSPSSAFDIPQHMHPPGYPPVVSSMAGNQSKPPTSIPSGHPVDNREPMFSARQVSTPPASQTKVLQDMLPDLQAWEAILNNPLIGPLLEHPERIRDMLRACSALRSIPKDAVDGSPMQPSLTDTRAGLPPGRSTSAPVKGHNDVRFATSPQVFLGGPPRDSMQPACDLAGFEGRSSPYSYTDGSSQAVHDPAIRSRPSNLSRIQTNVPQGGGPSTSASNHDYAQELWSLLYSHLEIEPRPSGQPPPSTARNFNGVSPVAPPPNSVGIGRRSTQLGNQRFIYPRDAGPGGSGN